MLSDNAALIAEFWDEFLKSTGRDLSTKYYECFYFGFYEALANELLELVLSGKKTATTGSLADYEKENQRIPIPGDLSIVTNWAGEPKCIIETTNVMVMPFKDMTYDICRREGEDDTLESWRQNHRKALTYGSYEPFDENMLIVFEDFKVVYRV